MKKNQGVRSENPFENWLKVSWSKLHVSTTRLKIGLINWSYLLMSFNDYNFGVTYFIELGDGIRSATTLLFPLVEYLCILNKSLISSI